MDGLTTTIRPGVIEIDTMLGGWEKRTAGYLITGTAPVLIETGSRSSVATLERALAELAIGPEDLAGVAVTHIHLDHAGGVGDIAAAFPKATIYVHELGARHLVDPTRLIASAERVYGDLLDGLYGRLEPTDKERIKVLTEGELIDVGNGRSVRAIDSPGHAKHHLGFLDNETGLLFAGDAVGVKLPAGGVLRPATPPADFDLDLALDSLRRFGELRPERICLTHYGLIDTAPDELLEEAADRLQAWAGIARRAFEAGEDITEALEAQFGEEFAELDEAERGHVEMLNSIHANADGLKRWLEQSTKSPGGPDPHAHR